MRRRRGGEIEHEGKKITNMIQEMLRRMGGMLQEIRQHTATTGFLMPSPVRKVVALTADQQVIRIMQGQHRINKMEGWRTISRPRAHGKEPRGKLSQYLYVDRHMRFSVCSQSLKF